MVPALRLHVESDVPPVRLPLEGVPVTSHLPIGAAVPGKPDARVIEVTVRPPILIRERVGVGGVEGKIPVKDVVRGVEPVVLDCVEEVKSLREDAIGIESAVEDLGVRSVARRTQASQDFIPAPLPYQTELRIGHLAPDPLELPALSRYRVPSIEGWGHRCGR